MTPQDTGDTQDLTYTLYQRMRFIEISQDMRLRDEVRIITLREMLEQDATLANIAVTHAQKEFSQTVLMERVVAHDTSVVRLLLNYGATPDTLCAVNELEQEPLKTPLMYAARMNYHDICTLLLDHGANPNAACPQGWTALMHAAANMREDILILLAGRGAFGHLSNQFNHTARDIFEASVHRFYGENGRLEPFIHPASCRSALSQARENSENYLKAQVENDICVFYQGLDVPKTERPTLLHPPKKRKL